MKHFKYLIFVFVLFLTPNVFAKDVNVTSNCYGSTGYSSMYNGQEVQYQTYSPFNFGTTYQYQLSSFETELRYNLSANTDYIATINTNNTNDFRNNFKTYNVYDLDNNDNNLVKSFTYVSMKKVQIAFKTTNATSRVKIQMGGSNNYDNITGENNWNIKSVVLTIPDSAPSGSTNQDIIDNQTNNTNNIINNNNQNTSDIINNNNQNTETVTNSIEQGAKAITDVLGNKCPNLYVPRLPQTTECGITVSPNDDGSYTLNGTSTCGIDFRLDQGYRNGATNLFSLSSGTYTFSSNTLPVGVSLNIFQQNTWVEYFSLNNSRSSQTNSYNSNINDLFIYVWVENNITLNNFVIKPMLVEGSSSKPYCEYGSYLSKLDDTTNAINETNEYLKDNSDPNIEDNDFLSMFNSVGVNDPLSYLLTLPTQLINKLVSLSDTCSSINLGTLYGVMITLPCINLENILGSSVWNIIDVIFSVSLLVVILKNLYDTFSNLLTMGAEKEAKEKFSMPTPMDFLSMILGGDR